MKNIPNPFDDVHKELAEIKGMLNILLEKNNGNDFPILPNILTRRDAAKMLGVSILTLDRYVKDGRIKCFKQGQIVWFEKNDISIAADNLKQWKWKKRPVNP